MSVFDNYRSGGGTSSGLADRVARSNDVFHKEEAKRKKKQPSAAQREAERQASVKPKKKDDGGIFGAIGDYAAGVNEKVLGGGTRAIVNAANLVGSGFNEKEASKRTKDFLTTTKQINKKGEAPLAAGEKRKSTAFKVGSSVGDTVNVVNPLTSPEGVIKSGIRLKAQYDLTNKGGNQQVKLDAIKNQVDYLNKSAKKGEISRAEADKKIKNLTKLNTKTTAQMSRAEKEVGAKYNPNAGFLDLVNVVGTTVGLAGLTKKVFQKTVSKAATDAGRDLTKEEVTSIAQKVKPTVKDKFLASKPTEFIFGDKKVVQDAVRKVGGANEPRAVKYQIDTTKPRVTPKEAEQKLKRAGYTTDESKKILEDVLPEKGLSMPGSPKKIGYKEDKILESAKQFDGPVDNLKQEALKYRSADEFVKSQGETFYHGTKRDFKQFGLNAETKQAHSDIAKLNLERDNLVNSGKIENGTLTIPLNARERIANIDQQIKEIYDRPNLLPSSVKEKGVYLTNDKSYAKTFAGKDGKILETSAKLDNPYIIKDKSEMDLIEDAAYYPEIIDSLEREGYDSIKAPDGQVLIFNPSKVQLKQQLTDLYNQAHSEAKTGEGVNVAPLASIEKTGEKGVSKLAASTKHEALKDKLIKKTQADTIDTPLYNKANMEQQAEYATNLIKDAPEDAVDIAMGRKAPPEHILQQMVYNAVEDHAKKIGGDKGANLLLQLSRSRQSTNLTKMGQEIRAAAERDPHSPVTMMNEVKLARAEAAKKRGKDFAAHAKKDAAAIKKATPKIKKETWDSFISSLEC